MGAKQAQRVKEIQDRGRETEHSWGNGKPETTSDEMAINSVIDRSLESLEQEIASLRTSIDYLAQKLIPVLGVYDKPPGTGAEVAKEKDLRSPVAKAIGEMGYRVQCHRDRIEELCNAIDL